MAFENQNLATCEVYYYGINHDGTLYDGDWTTNAVGYWYNTDEDVCIWGEPDMYGTGAERLAYLEGDGYYFTLGFEDHDAYVGETITLRGMYVHGDLSVEVDYLIYVEAKAELPEQESAFEVHVDLENYDYDYLEYDLSDYFTLASLAEAIGVNDVENAIYADDVYVTAYGSDGELIAYDKLTYTCDGVEYNGSGWWFDASGQVTEWGNDSHVGVCDETGEYTFTYGSVWIMDDASDTEYITYLAYVNATDETVEPQLVKFYVYIDPIEIPDVPETNVIIEVQDFHIGTVTQYADVQVAINETYLNTINSALGCDIDASNVYVYMWNPSTSTACLSDPKNYPGDSVLPNWDYMGSGPYAIDGWFDEWGPCVFPGTIYLQLRNDDNHTFTTGTSSGSASEALGTFYYENTTTEDAVKVYINAVAQ